MATNYADLNVVLKVYKNGIPNLKENERFVLTGEFRVPKNFEYYVDPDKLSVANDETLDYRLIVQEIDLIQSVYGHPKSKLTAPEGYEFTGEFRIPKFGELCLPNGWRVMKDAQAYKWQLRDAQSPTYRRLILRELPMKKEIRRWMLTETLEKPRLLKTGEFGVTWANMLVQNELGKEAKALMATPLRLEEMKPVKVTVI